MFQTTNKCLFQEDHNWLVTGQLHTKLQKGNISITLDESTRTTDSAQVFYFIQATIEDFICYKEFGQSHQRKWGIDIFTSIQDKCLEVEQDLVNLVSMYRWCTFHDKKTGRVYIAWIIIRSSCSHFFSLYLTSAKSLC